MIKLIVDSAADIGKEEADRLGIIMIPMVISFDDQDYLDGVNLSPTDFFNKLIECKTLPKTSQINPFRFEELFEQNLVNDDDQLLVITISSKLSGTYQNALTAAANFNNRVHVIDSLNACIG